MRTDFTLEQRIEQGLRRYLNERRYLHTMGVVDSAVHLARKYGADEDAARLAALMHDYCKNMSKEQYDEYIKRYRIDFDEIARGNRELMHGRVARYIAEKEYEIHDPEILSAIEYHTTGRKGMSLLEKIIAVADYIEEGRDFPGVEEIRILAAKNLEEALIFAINGTIRHLMEKNLLIHLDTIEARNDLIREIKAQTEV